MTEQLTDRYCVLVNGHAVEPGCWVDGHWGQYGPDHLADRAEELGWEPATPSDDPRWQRAEAERLMDDAPPGGEPYCKNCRVHVDWIDTPTVENPRLRKAIHRPGRWTGACLQPEPVWPSAGAWEAHTESADDIEKWLNEHTETEGYTWHWHDGEFYLSPICDDPEECDDDTCAHWD